MNRKEIQEIQKNPLPILFQIDSMLFKVHHVSSFLMHGVNLPTLPFPILYLHLIVVKRLLISNLNLSQTPTSHKLPKKKNTNSKISDIYYYEILVISFYFQYLLKSSFPLIYNKQPRLQPTHRIRSCYTVRTNSWLQMMFQKCKSVTGRLKFPV